MRADRDERHVSAENRGRHSAQTILTAIAVLILAGAAYLLAPGDEEDAVPEPRLEDVEEPVAMPVAPRPTPAEAIAAAPDIPEEPPEPEEAPPSEPPPQMAGDPSPEAAPLEPTAPPPPTPEEIDARIRTGIAEAGLTVDEALAGALAAPYLLDRTVSSLDQAARGLVPRRTLNLPRPQGRFPTVNEGQDYRVDPAGYARYDAMVAAATAVPVDILATLFRRFRPELTEAYASLGYPADAMDNTLIAALESVIDAPVRETPPALRSKGAVWAYADPELEAATDLQKQLLRTGPANTRALQRWAEALKSALLNP